jgi:hypothetical protein
MVLAGCGCLWLLFPVPDIGLAPFVWPIDIAAEIGGI